MSKAVDVILGVMNDVQAVAKKEKNAAQGFNFRGIDAVVNAVGPAFRKHGGFVVPSVINKTNSVLPTKNGGSINAVSLEVEFAVYGTEGEPVRGTVAAEAFDSGDKATAKAMSVALRTFLLQTLLLPTDEPDPDSHSYELGQTAKTDLGVLIDWAEAISAASSEQELQTQWAAVAGFADEQFKFKNQITSLKALIFARKAEVK